MTERVPFDAIDALFARNAQRWSPQAVHRAKSLGQTQSAYQLDFVDLGLMPAIEHEIEQKLDRLLARVIERLLAHANDAAGEEAVFRTTFRLLAAKILVDRRHPDATLAAKSFSKPMAVLRTLIDAGPDALGFVLPQGFLRQAQYADLRQRLAKRYERIHLTSLPDRIFQRAGLEVAVITASGLRVGDEKTLTPTNLHSTEVSDRDRPDFLSKGKVTSERRRLKSVSSGDLWIGALDELWEYLATYPVLGQRAEVYRGLQWISQGDGWSKAPRDGFVRGVLKPADSLKQFTLTGLGYVDVRGASALYPGPLKRAWEKPKVIVNVARRSRGPWRLDGHSTSLRQRQSMRSSALSVMSTD